MTRNFLIWLWLCGFVPAAIAFVLLPERAWVQIFTALLMIDLAHVISPMALAWTHGGLRRLMIGRPYRFLVVPGALFALAASVTIVTASGLTSYAPGPESYHHATGWDNPFPIMFAIYFVWNFWHFAMQNYGVMRLCGFRGSGGRALALVWTALAVKIAPVAVSINHWIVDIGLSYRMTTRKWLFAAPLVLLPPVVLARHIEAIAFILFGLRISVSFVHFWYSRCLHKQSVRMTIACGPAY